MTQPLFFLGIDGGATHCRVILENAEGRIIGKGLGGSANPSHGMQVVSSSIVSATEMALQDAGLDKSAMDKIVVGAGLAGLHLPRYRKMAADWQHPFAHLYLIDDLQAACLGAHKGQDGAVIIAGTGFSAAAVINGKSHGIGGFGFLMGDFCSGSWIGHQALQKVLLANDYLHCSTLLQESFKQKFAASGAELANAFATASPKEFAALAPLVFAAAEQGDETAEQILQQSANFITQVANRLFRLGAPKLSLVGSVANALHNRLPADIQQRLCAPIQPPEIGALSFAHQQFNQHRTNARYE